MVLDMSSDKEHIKHLVIYEFGKGLRVSQAFKNINDVYSNWLNKKTCYRWFEKLKYFDVENHPRSSRSGEIDNDWLNSL